MNKKSLVKTVIVYISHVGVCLKQKTEDQILLLVSVDSRLKRMDIKTCKDRREISSPRHVEVPHGIPKRAEHGNDKAVWSYLSGWTSHQIALTPLCHHRDSEIPGEAWLQFSCLFLLTGSIVS